MVRTNDAAAALRFLHVAARVFGRATVVDATDTCWTVEGNDALDSALWSLLQSGVRRPDITAVQEEADAMARQAQP